MKAITLEELKKIELELLLKVDKICRRENIRYSLCGGTLLGAVRHKGFIPWDDDIDIFMPRPDYERFIEYCQNSSIDFNLKSVRTSNTCYDLYSKAMDLRTLIVDENIIGGDASDQGVYIDIFPIDGLGNNVESAKKQYRKTRFSRELLTAAKWKRFFRSKTHAWYIEPIRFVFYVLSRFVNKTNLTKSIEQQMKEVEFESAEYCGCICGSYREREIMHKKAFTQLRDTEFEGHLFKAMVDYDTYLTQLYGDYMQLPPVEKRQTHHTFEAYWKE